MQPTPSAKSLSGYFWTVQDDRYEDCPSCAMPKPTYCQTDQDDASRAVVCCCSCQRILRRELIDG